MLKLVAVKGSKLVEEKCNLSTLQALVNERPLLLSHIKGVSINNVH